MNSRALKSGALAGILFPILQMIAQAFIQVGGVEPAFDAPASEILAFFESRSASLSAVGDFLSLVSLILFVWFLASLWLHLKSAEGEPGFFAAAALLSGIGSIAMLSGGGWSLAFFRSGEGLSPEIAQLLFDEGNLGFANYWVMLGSMLIAAGMVFRSASSFPRWWAWFSLALGVALVLARIAWTSQAAFVLYILYWVWMIVVGLGLFRRS